MTILPQKPPVFHPSAAVLMLPTPKIAGLLPAKVYAEPPQPPPRPTELIFDDPRLAELMPWAFADFRREMLTCFEAAVSLLVGETDRQQFARATTRFNGQIALLYNLLIPADQQAPLPVMKTLAELDEELDAMRQHFRQELIDQHEETTRRQAARRAYWEGKAQP